MSDIFVTAVNTAVGFLKLLLCRGNYYVDLHCHTSPSSSSSSDKTLEEIMTELMTGSSVDGWMPVSVEGWIDGCLREWMDG